MGPPSLVEICLIQPSNTRCPISKQNYETQRNQREDETNILSRKKSMTRLRKNLRLKLTDREIKIIMINMLIVQVVKIAYMST